MTLAINRLTYRLKSKTILSCITLTFQPGLLYGILGPNGSGKSTLFKTMTGIWSPTEGEVFWQGQHLLNLPRYQISRTVSLVPQTPSLYFDFTVTDMVAMGRYPHYQGLSSQENNLIEDCLKKVDAWHLRHQLLSQLSGGERQRIYIARALATEAPVLLLDEPTSYLDLRHQLEIWELLQLLARQGKTIVTAVHDLLAAQRFCDRLAILNQGKCVATGAYADIVTPSLLRDIFGVQWEQGGAYFEL
ncbi:ABC transporter ATP-binding protein [Candidatus Protochlamydia phocaeensis]|uniref:ABC transporter ATP-binding protein n=1 Tax=Candidatus Protochlamydia phocaeensis TaxID=1414722 RepID=UPI0008396815|nr:ABC transporter ATP-binding protein [Candidatus Protochlamydia phocaeensis]